jgi:peptide/nickel transport system permease protein
MRTFVVRRLFYMALSIVAATAIVFALSRMAGDPRLLYAKPGGYGVSEEAYEALGRKLGLDKPLVVQYFMWLGRMLRGDLGNTLLDEKPVSRVLGEKVGATLQLGMAAWLFATLVGVPLGVLSAVKRGTVWDYIGRGFALFGQALPAFWVGIMAILLFAVELGWFPSGTRGTHRGFPLVWENLRFYIMPAITLGWLAAAGYLRLTRSAMLEVLDSEFIKLARAKGVNGWKVIWKHAFRNALIPPLTFSALLMAGFITGAVVVETVYAWPGVGRMAVEAVHNNDFPVLTGSVLMFTLVFVTVNFLADLAYAFIDPRIRYA